MLYKLVQTIIFSFITLIMIPAPERDDVAIRLPSVVFLGPCQNVVITSRRPDALGCCDAISSAVPACDW